MAVLLVYFAAVLRPSDLFFKTSSSRAPMHPRLQLLKQGDIIVVQFGDAVTLGAKGALIPF